MMGKQPHRKAAVQPHEPKQAENSEDVEHPPPEEDFGGGDFASPEICPPTDDDRPLD